jgi:hypothetical protein
MPVSSLWEGRFCGARVFYAKNKSLRSIVSVSKLSLDMKDVKASGLCPSITASLILEICKVGAESWTLLL